MVVERLVGLQVEGRRGKEFGGNDNDFGNLWLNGSLGAGGRRQTCVRLRSWSAGCFCLTLPLPFRVIKVADACKGLLLLLFVLKSSFFCSIVCWDRQVVSCERKMTLKHVVL